MYTCAKKLEKGKVYRRVSEEELTFGIEDDGTVCRLMREDEFFFGIIDDGSEDGILCQLEFCFDNPEACWGVVRKLPSSFELPLSFKDAGDLNPAHTNQQRQQPASRA